MYAYSKLEKEKNVENCKIRTQIEKYRIKHYEIAEFIGISEFTFCRWLRRELTGEKLKLVESAIETLKERVK